MGRVGSCFDNAAAESFFSTLEHEVLSRHTFTTKAEARNVELAWCHEFDNTRRRHSSAALLAPPSSRRSPLTNRQRHNEVLHGLGGTPVFDVRQVLQTYGEHAAAVAQTML